MNNFEIEKYLFLLEKRQTILTLLEIKNEEFFLKIKSHFSLINKN